MSELLCSRQLTHSTSADSAIFLSSTSISELLRMLARIFISFSISKEKSTIEINLLSN